MICWSVSSTVETAMFKYSELVKFLSDRVSMFRTPFLSNLYDDDRRLSYS